MTFSTFSSLASSTSTAYSTVRIVTPFRLNLGNHYTVVHSVILAQDLTELNISNKHRLTTMDIKDLYVNIPITETIDITTAA